jgi:hypothetical protein
MKNHKKNMHTDRKCIKRRSQKYLDDFNKSRSIGFLRMNESKNFCILIEREFVFV